MNRTLRDVRDGAILVAYPDAPEDEANAAAVALGDGLRASPPRGLLDAVPGARSLLVLFDPARLSHERVGRIIASTRARDPGRSAARRLWKIPVAYGEADLFETSRGAGLTPEEFARRHAAAEYRVAFLGFAPGFAYLTGLPEELHAPRLSRPRTRVPAGSVAIGGPHTGIYPAASPGGWRLIGRTTVRLFDPDADPPALLSAGDRVRFEAVGSTELPSVAPPVAPVHRGREVLRVVSPGLATTIQGTPCHGLRSSGVPAGGAMDGDSLARANAALGNRAGDPALEMGFVGPELEALADCVVALAGADLGAEWNGRAAPQGAVLRLVRGDRLKLRRARDGARGYLAVLGGFETPGRSFAPAPRASPGDTLWAASIPEASARLPAREPAASGNALRLRVMLGPEADRFAPTDVDLLLTAPWRVSHESDRRGIRLEGPPLSHLEAPEIPPSGTLFGSIQVPGDGLPIVLGPDGPVTGGYPRIATVIGSDVFLLGQAAPGATVRFAAVTLPEALAARRSSGSTMSVP